MSEQPNEGEYLRIMIYPDEVLRRTSAAVGRAGFDGELERLARSMARTMHEGGGVGLAAPQVGVSLRLVIVASTPDPEDASKIVLVNPVIVDSRGRDVAEEGCLSIPGVEAKVRRRARVTVEYETLAGERTGLEADGLLARVIQHEIDHLDGALFVDRLGPAGRIMVRKALRQLEERTRAEG